MHLPILHDFHRERALGIVTKVWEESDAYHFEALFKATRDVDDAWKKVQKGIYDHVSIYGSRIEGSSSCSLDPAQRAIPCVTHRIRLDSISACDENARNDETFMSVAKSFSRFANDPNDTIIKAETTNSNIMHSIYDGADMEEKVKKGDLTNVMPSPAEHKHHGEPHQPPKLSEGAVARGWGDKQSGEIMNKGEDMGDEEEKAYSSAGRTIESQSLKTQKEQGIIRERQGRDSEGKKIEEKAKRKDMDDKEIDKAGCAQYMKGEHCKCGGCKHHTGKEVEKGTSDNNTLTAHKGVSGSATAPSMPPHMQNAESARDVIRSQNIKKADEPAVDVNEIVKAALTAKTDEISKAFQKQIDELKTELEKVKEQPIVKAAVVIPEQTEGRSRNPNYQAVEKFMKKKRG